MSTRPAIVMIEAVVEMTLRRLILKIVAVRIRKDNSGIERIKDYTF